MGATTAKGLMWDQVSVTLVGGGLEMPFPESIVMGRAEAAATPQVNQPFLPAAGSEGLEASIASGISITASR
jgi:hypothetical protein